MLQVLLRCATLFRCTLVHRTRSETSSLIKTVWYRATVHLNANQSTTTTQRRKPPSHSWLLTLWSAYKGPHHCGAGELSIAYFYKKYLGTRLQAYTCKMFIIYITWTPHRALCHWTNLPCRSFTLKRCTFLALHYNGTRDCMHAAHLQCGC